MRAPLLLVLSLSSCAPSLPRPGGAPAVVRDERPDAGPREPERAQATVLDGGTQEGRPAEPLLTLAPNIMDAVATALAGSFKSFAAADEHSGSELSLRRSDTKKQAK